MYIGIGVEVAKKNAVHGAECKCGHVELECPASSSCREKAKLKALIDSFQ